MSSYTWDVLPAIGTSETMETDIRDTLEQWRQNMEDMNDEWDGFTPAESYLYIAYASDDSGTGFTMTFNAALDYVAMLQSATEITSPQASDFAGLWKKYAGDDGTPGVDGEVAGPVTSTDNAIPRWHETDGTTLQDSAVTIDDDGSVNIPSGQTYKINGTPHTHSYLADVVNDTTPQLGGNLDINEKSIEHEFGTLAGDVTASGDIITATAGENVAFGNICYFKSDGKFWKTDADAEATSIGMIAMAIATISGDASGLFLKRGFARNDAWNWTVAAQLFLDTATAGGMTATAPSGTGDIVRLVAVAKAADYVEFNPSQIYLEIA